MVTRHQSREAAFASALAADTPYERLNDVSDVQMAALCYAAETMHGGFAILSLQRRIGMYSPRRSQSRRKRIAAAQASDVRPRAKRQFSDGLLPWLSLRRHERRTSRHVPTAFAADSSGRRCRRNAGSRSSCGNISITALTRHIPRCNLQLSFAAAAGVH